MIEKAKNIIADLFWKFVLFLVVHGVRTYLLIFYRPKMVFLGKSVTSTDLKQPMVIIANHTSMLDPLMVQSLFFHKRSIVVAKDQVEDPHFHWALSRFKNVIPCDRFNLDTEWALLAKKELEKGNSVIIFPEGKCRYDGLMNEFKTGFAFLARSTGAPVLSVGIDGIYKIGHRTQIVVDEPETIERVKGIPSSKYLAERSEYFRQKVWNLKQRALGQTEAILPVAAETPEEIVPEESK